MKKSIGTKLVLQIALVLLLTMSIFGAWEVYQQRKQLTTSLQAKEDRSLEQIALILGNLLYEVNRDQINSVMKSYLTDPEILEMKVTELGEVTHHMRKTPRLDEVINLKREEAPPLQFPDIVSKEQEVTFEGERLGQLEIIFSRQSIHAQELGIIKNKSLNFLLLVILESLVVLTLVRKNITKPLLELAQAARQIADGDVGVHLPGGNSRDEIGLLTSAFQTLLDFFQTMASLATSIAAGQLHQEITPRSEKDVVGKDFQRMVSYLNEIASVAKNVAEGDLAVQVRVRSDADEFAQVIKSMTEKLRTLIVQIRTSAEQIATTEDSISELADKDITIVEKVNDSAERMMATMREVGASLEEVANNMETLTSQVGTTSQSAASMTGAITNIAANTTQLTQQTHQTIKSLDDAVKLLEKVVQNTDTSKDLSQETIRDALEGQQAVEQVTASMETIQQTVTTAVEIINQFAQQSQDIDRILDVIREITEQTSLLALNASIIAAQAGSHGRGFAVVADEIKSLADGVGTSTKDIAAIVQTLQQDTNKVVKIINEGAGDVKQGMDRTQQARQTLQKIINSAERSSQVVSEIADALKDLQTTSNDVVTAMEQVNSMTDHITVATNEQESSTGQINQSIDQINEMASQIQRATSEQLGGIQNLLQVTNEVTRLNNQNLESSGDIARTTEDLSSQANILLESVARFKLDT